MYHLDARSTGVYVGLDLDPDTEREFVGRECGVTGFYPIMQPFWKALGERNSITFYDRGRYTAVIQHMLYTRRPSCCFPRKRSATTWTPSTTSSSSLCPMATWW